MIKREDKIEKEKIDEFLYKAIKGEIDPDVLFGALGNMEDAYGTAFIEEKIFPKEGGSYLKILGCSYLFKGSPFGIIPTYFLEVLHLAKGLLVRLPMDTLKSWYWGFVFLFSWLFFRKRFYYLINTYVSLVYERTILSAEVVFDKKRYNRYAVELKRAFAATLQRIKKTDKPLTEYQPKEAVKDRQLRILAPINKLFELFVFILEFDFAYRPQVQDALEELNKENDPTKELVRIIEIMLERYQLEEVREKYVFLKRAINLLKFSPLFKRIVKNFFAELDIEKIKLDEADRYFTLKRTEYNFGGKSIEERAKEKERIDKEAGHILIQFRAVKKEEFDKIKGQDILVSERV